MPEAGYIAFIDESGDDGIKYVKPSDPRSASEWMVLSAVVVRMERHHEVQPWTKDILLSLSSPQAKSIHFAKLSPRKRLITAKKLSGLGVRCFVAISNKRNMSGYYNPRAATVSTKSFFYNWMTRLLLESVTDFCARDSMARYGEIRKLRVDFSRRDGVSLPHIIDYLARLEKQSATGNLVVKTRDIAWPVVDLSQLSMLDPPNRPGLQLADILAGSFYQALGDQRHRLKPSPDCAIELNRAMAKNANGWRFGYSVKVMPNLNDLVLAPDQKPVFDFYRGK
jgi:hypothetical protein